MRSRRLVVVLLVLASCAILPGSPATSEVGSAAILVCPAPPADLELPIDQGIEIRCRLQARFSATLTFWVDGLWLGSRQAPPGGLAAAAWQPAETGTHVLTIALWAGGRKVATITRRVVVRHAGAPVRIP